MYRLKSHDTNSFLNYRHNAKQKKQMSLLPSINCDGNNSITPNEIIKNWSAIAKGAFVGQFKESSLPCWPGHYEQFGRLMYELYAISENRNVRLAKYSVEYQYFFPLVKDLKFIPLAPSGTEDDTSYRIWFKMLCHPDFSGPIIDGLETDTYATWTYWFTKVYCELDAQVIRGLI
jgi:hypothetical protein